MVFNHKVAVEKFDEWYQLCLENGVEPEKVVKEIGGMALITNVELVKELENSGEI